MDISKGLPEADLEALIGDRDYKLFLNSRNDLYRERGMAANPPARKEAIRLMSENPNLVRRPILVKGKKIVFGWNEQEMRSLL